MSFSRLSTVLRIIFVSLLFFTSTIIFSTSQAQDVTLTLGNPTGALGEQYIPLDLRISSLTDTIAGFEIWIQMDRPDIVEFMADSTLNFVAYDTSSLLMPNWSLTAHPGYGMPTILQLISHYQPGHTDYLNPPINDELFMTIYLRVADSLLVPPVDSVVNMFIETSFIDHFEFFDPQSARIGMIYQYAVDTNCFQCTEWSGNDCLNYTQIPNLGDCDSIDIVTDSFLVIDTSYFDITNGTFTLLPTCGFSLGSYDISNLVALVDYMFTGGIIIPLEEADCNCDCMIDISDLVCFIDYMFNGGASPGCGTK